MKIKHLEMDRNLALYKIYQTVGVVPSGFVSRSSRSSTFSSSDVLCFVSSSTRTLSDALSSVSCFILLPIVCNSIDTFLISVWNVEPIRTISAYLSSLFFNNLSLIFNCSSTVWSCVVWILHKCFRCSNSVQNGLATSSIDATNVFSISRLNSSVFVFINWAQFKAAADEWIFNAARSQLSSAC